MRFPPRKRWTKAEKWMLITPLLVAIPSALIFLSPAYLRHRRGLPDTVLWVSPHGPTLGHMVLSANGAVLAASTSSENADGDEVRFWDAHSLRPCSTWHISRAAATTEETTPRGFALSPDAQQLLVTRALHPLRALDTTTRQTKWRFRPLPNCGDVAFVPGGHDLLVSNLVPTLNSDGADRYRVEFHRLRASDGHWQSSWSVDALNDTFALSQDGKTVALIARDWTHQGDDNVQLRRATDGKLIRTLDVRDPQSMTWSPDGSQLVVVHEGEEPNSNAQTVSCLRPASGQRMWALKNQPSNSKRPIKYPGVCFSPDGQTVAAYASHLDQILLLDSSTGAVRHILHMGGHSDDGGDWHPLVFSPDGRRLFARGKNAVLVWDLN